jgi:hypothetical protein
VRLRSTLAASVQGDDLLLTVQIRYLAQRIDPAFTTFAVQLRLVEALRFSTWPKDSAAPPEVLREARAIFSPELDILSGESSDGLVRVACNQPSPQATYRGGELVFRAASAVVRDQDGKQ